MNPTSTAPSSLRSTLARGLLLCVALAFAAAATAGDERFAEAKAALDEANASGDGKHPGYVRAHAIMQTLADEGDIRARYHLGVLYMFGLGDAPFEQLTGLQHVRTAAEGGYPMAQSYMGFLTENSDGMMTVKGDDVALGWWRKAAEGGHCTAVRRLERVYRNGELGVAPDAAAADAWAARQADCSKN